MDAACCSLLSSSLMMRYEPIHSLWLEEPLALGDFNARCSDKLNLPLTVNTMGSEVLKSSCRFNRDVLNMQQHFVQ